ncbi:uncharacterized protein VTP21DRAFT_10265 [Calcarisporiella thermophila]|uniref:uncharacterized protein n=1 Tax=Calcarisporiella thermophila TaxID=911321 RepID=UPI003743B7AD
MRFLHAFFAFFALVLFVVSAEKEPAILQFYPAPRIFPPEYRIRANLLLSRKSYEIILRTQEPNWLASYPERSRGLVEYNVLPGGPYDAVINDNVNDGGEKILGIKLSRRGADFLFKGSSVTDEVVHDLPAKAIVRPIDDDD